MSLRCVCAQDLDAQGYTIVADMSPWTRNEAEHFASRFATERANQWVAPKLPCLTRDACNALEESIRHLHLPSPSPPECDVEYIASSQTFHVFGSEDLAESRTARTRLNTASQVNGLSLAGRLPGVRTGTGTSTSPSASLITAVTGASSVDTTRHPQLLQPGQAGVFRQGWQDSKRQKRV